MQAIDAHKVRRMRWIIPAVAAACALASCQTASSASADPAMSERLEQQQSHIALLTNQNPHLADIRVFLAGICRKDFSAIAEPKQTAFCQCGSTTTLSLWLPSDQMKPIINDYLAAPTETKLASLEKYQGPELYQPFCSKAVGI